MKIISLKGLFQQGWNTFTRFPMAILLGITGSIVSIYLTYLSYVQLLSCDKYYSIIFTCALGIPFSISIVLYSERKKSKKLLQYIFQLIGLLVLSGYYFIQPHYLYAEDYIRFFVLFIALVMLVSFIAFTGKNEINGFWHFNMILFIRFLIASIYSLVLYIGISLALLAIDNLFNVSIEGKIYFRLWIIIVGIVNLWLFLAGISENIESLENQDLYPKGLKVFTQYILLPLVVLYFVILYAYSFKIFILWKLPFGWVSYLVLGYSFLGIFSLLLLFPLQFQSDNFWIKKVAKYFYLSLFPLMILLIIAIKTRISEYGWTENRYYVFILAVWLSCISIYLLINKIKNIKVIPVSLLIVALLTLFGPFGAFKISVKSQLKRFEIITAKNDILKNGKLNKIDKKIPLKDNKSICSILDYICEIHGYKSLQPYFAQNLDSLIKKNEKEKPEKIMELMGLEYINRWQREKKDTLKYFDYYSDFNDFKKGINVTGYQYVINIKEEKMNWKGEKQDQYKLIYNLGDTLLNITYITKNGILNFKIYDSIKIDMNLKDFVKKLNDKNNLNDKNIKIDEMIFKSGTVNLNIMIIFDSITGSINPNKNSEISVGSFHCNVYLKLKS